MVGDEEHTHRISSSDGRRRRSRIHFEEGSMVEVRTNEEGMKGIFFSATVIPPPPPPSTTDRPRKKSRKLLYVEYHDLLADDGGSERLRKYVDVSLVRPQTPVFQEEDENDRGFRADDVVEAFYQDGWWIGVVSRVVEGGEMVVVRFQDSPDELEFGIGDVRAHWDWANGIWAKKQSLGFMKSMFGVGRAVEISLRERCYQDAIVHRDFGNGVLLVEYDVGEDVITEIDSGNVRPCPPVLLDDEKRLVSLMKIDAFFDHAWWSGVITKELEDGRYVVLIEQTKEEKEFDQWNLRPHMEWKDGQWLLQYFSEDEDEEVQSFSDSVVVDKNGGNDQLESRSTLIDKDRNMSSVWEALESMEVFQKIPQKPHFQPLKHFRESLREGLAIGHMVTFSGLVEKACKLQLNDPKNTIDEIMEALAEMEGYGFKVSIVQDKLTKLLGLKAIQEKLSVEVKNVNNHITEHKHKKSTIEEEIQEIDEQIRKLQEKISLAESTKEKVGGEIASLQGGLKEAEESIKIIECDFEGMVSSFV